MTSTGTLETVPAGSRPLLARRGQPSRVRPTLARLTDAPFSDPGWVFEPKLDGERIVAFRSGRDTWLMTRNNKTANDQYPEIVDALAAQPADDFVVDGEVIAIDGGVSSFAPLQPRIQASDPRRARESPAVYFYAFDLLHVDGWSTARLALRDRKAVLRRLLSYGGTVRFSRHRNTHGEQYWREACGKGWEGVIAKRADAPYRYGRTRDWLKFKCENTQEFVIAGFTEPQGQRIGFGALLLGYYEGKKLVYAGKVGTGFDNRMLQDLGHELGSLERQRTPYAQGDPPRARVHWVQPRLVGQIAFTEWTHDGQLRHPRFQGLRRDKSPSEVIKEHPKR